MDNTKKTDPASGVSSSPRPPHPVDLYFSKLSRYHYYIFTFLFVSKTPIFWHFVSLIFLTPPMNFKCTVDGVVKENYCPCPNPVLDTSVFTETVQTKFPSTVCNKTLKSSCHSILYFGALLGSFLFGFMADKYGRLKMFCACSLFLALFGSLVGFMPNIASFIFMRLMEGIGIGGAIVTGYVLCVEYCGIKHRALVTALYHIPLNVGHLTLAGISYLMRRFSDLQLAISIPIFFFVIMNFVCLESPKWLMDSNQVDKAVEVMTKIAKCNNTSYGDVKSEMEAYRAAHISVNEQKAKFWDIFRYKRLVINFFCMSYIYFACGMGFYGVSQYIGIMSGNIHINVTLSGAMLIPATLSCVVLLHYLSRKTYLIITSVFSGCLLLSVVLLIPANMKLLRVVVACLGNCFFWMSFIIVFLYGVELFPTSVRNSVLGILAVMSRIGQILAPFINELPPKVSGCIFGVLAVLGAVFCIPLPETKNKEMPSSLEAYSSKNTPAASGGPGGVNIK